MNGNLSQLAEPQQAVEKTPPSSNAAYAGVMQEDDPKSMDSIGEQEANERARVNLAAHVANIFESNKMLRESNGIDEELAKRLRQMNGEYDPDDLSQIMAKGQPLAYINISAHKQRTLVAWLTEFFSNSEKSFYIKHTPVPEMAEEVTNKAVDETMKGWLEEYATKGKPPDEEVVFEYASIMRDKIFKEMSEEAKKCAYRMDRRLKDDMVEGKWSNPVDAFINLLAMYGTAGLRSPVIRLKKLPAYKKTKYGKRVIDEIKMVREGEAISPWDMFPSNGAVDAQEGDFCIRVRYSPKELRQVTNLPCYFDENIQSVLDRYGESGVRVRVTSDSIRERLEKKDSSEVRNAKIMEGIECWCQASGEMLIGLGITRTPDKSPIKGEEWYEVNAIVIDGYVIYCRVIDSAEERPIDVGGVYKMPGSFWHQGPLHVIDHIQRLCNATTRNLLVNMGFASGPQAVMDDMSRLHPMDDGKARPNKTWAFTNNGQNPNKPISFFDIPSVAEQMISIFQFYMRLADEITGIPAFANGTDAAVGAARTKGGLQMLFGAANRGIKKIVANMDDVLKSCVMRLYWWHMRFNKDESIKGDIDVEVCGVRQFTMREELANKQLEFLRVIGQDQRMMQLQHPEELAKMVRDIAIGFEMDPDNVAPEDDEMKRRIEEAKAKAEEQMAMQLSAMQQQAQASQQQGQGQPQQAPQQQQPQMVQQ